MIYSANFTNFPEELERFAGRDDLMDTLAYFGCSGIELNYSAANSLGYIDASMVNSVHLPSPPAWMDLWLGNRDALIREYGDLETMAMYFGGSGPEDFVRLIRTAMDKAAELDAAYVVFHVCEVKLWEMYTRTFDYSDREVAHETAQFLNEVMEGRDYPFELLLENLWWPGLTFHDPDIPFQLLEEVKHPKTGFVLDTGHMMNSELSLRTADEAVGFIMKKLSAIDGILPHIRAMHLCESLSGEYAASRIQDRPKPGKTYPERFGQAFTDIFKIDQHFPISSLRYRDLIEMIGPSFIVHELITGSREEWERKMTQQCRCLGMM